MTAFAPNLADHILILLFAILLPLQSIGAQRQLKHIRFTSDMKIRLYTGNSIGLWVMAILVLTIWLVSGRSLAQLGLEWPIRPLPGIAWLVLAIFVLLYAVDTVQDIFGTNKRRATHQEWREKMSFLPTTAYEYRYFILLSLSAGICEEIVFRGYFISYFYSLSDGSALGANLAILVPAIIFGAVHTYQGWKAVIKVTAMAVLFGFVFLRTGSLWLLILLHIMVDLVGGYLSWWLAGEFGEEEEE